MDQKVKKDQDLIGEFRNGSPEAFERFYNTYSPLIFGIAMKVLKDKRDAEDLCHDVFIEIYRNPHSFDSNRGSVEAWLAVKTKSRCLDHIRKKKQSVSSCDDIVEKESDPALVEEQVFRKTDQELVHNALKQLPVPQREAVYKSFFKGYTHREIAESLNRPLGTVKSLVRYGVTNMRKLVEKHRPVSKSGGENNDM